MWSANREGERERELLLIAVDKVANGRPRPVAGRRRGRPNIPVVGASSHSLGAIEGRQSKEKASLKDGISPEMRTTRDERTQQQHNGRATEWGKWPGREPGAGASVCAGDHQLPAEAVDEQLSNLLLLLSTRFCVHMRQRGRETAAEEAPTSEAIIEGPVNSQFCARSDTKQR